MLRVLFTVVYFAVFLVLIDLVFRHTVNPLADLAAAVCWAVTFLISVGLAESTVRWMERHKK